MFDLILNEQLLQLSSHQSGSSSIKASIVASRSNLDFPTPSCLYIEPFCHVCQGSQVSQRNLKRRRRSLMILSVLVALPGLPHCRTQKSDDWFPLICKNCDCNSLPREHSQRTDYKWLHEASPIIAAGPEERWRVKLAARQVGEDKDVGVGGAGGGGIQCKETSAI